MSGTIGDLRSEIERLQQWIHDLQSGMYINCVYCGHRYGPQDEVPATMADALKEHIAQCPKHPMSKVLQALERGHALVIGAFNHVSHGGPTRSEAAAWLSEAEKAIADAKAGGA